MLEHCPTKGERMHLVLEIVGWIIIGICLSLQLLLLVFMILMAFPKVNRRR